MNERAIEPSETGGMELLRPVADVGDILAQRDALEALLTRALQAGLDYGTVPGASKPTLLQPGAEKLAAAFGLSPRYEIVEAEVDHTTEFEWRKSGHSKGGDWQRSGSSVGTYRYVVRCTLVQRTTGRAVGEAIASASTFEDRYVERPRQLENTVLQIAQKRAYVRAVRGALGLSDRFTQDLEDAIEEAGPVPHVVEGPVRKRQANRPTLPAVERAQWLQARGIDTKSEVWGDFVRAVRAAGKTDAWTYEMLQDAHASQVPDDELIAHVLSFLEHKESDPFEAD